MRILTDCSFLSEKQIEKIAGKYNATYVFESQLKLRGGNWSDFSAAVFYTEIPHPEGSNWFGIWDNAGKYMISNAISAVEEPFFGILGRNGDVIYSRHPQPSPHFSSQVICNLRCKFGFRNTRYASLAAREFGFSIIVGGDVPRQVATSST